MFREKFNDLIIGVSSCEFLKSFLIFIKDGFSNY
jgi:hypothetical protein